MSLKQIRRQLDFYPRPPRGGRPNHPFHREHWRKISIHALREEGDLFQRRPGAVKEISIHALREEGDAFSSHKAVDVDRFLSTPSARRATHQKSAGPRRGAISIHALREEGDRRFPAGLGNYIRFLSTPSARRATPEHPVMLQE